MRVESESQEGGDEERGRQCRVTFDQLNLRNGVYYNRLEKKEGNKKSRLTNLLHVLDRKEPLGVHWQGNRPGVDRPSQYQY